MADNAPTTTQSNDGNSLLNFAIGLSVLDALGNSGEVVGRRNSPFFNTTYDAFGFPRDRFSLIQNIMPQQQGMGMWGGELRDVLGNNAEVYGRSDSAFSFAMMNMLAGGGIFGLLMGLAAINAQAEHDRQRQAEAGATGPAVGPAGNGTTPTTATPGIVPAKTGGQPAGELSTIAIPGEDGQTPAIVPANAPNLPVIRREDPRQPTLMGIEQPDRLRREMELAEASRVTTTSSAASAAGNEITVPAGVVAPAVAVCEQPKENTSIDRNCVLPARPPRGPSGM
ncbi:MAG: hypothetical protein ACAH80_04965 [Alphaproteobacteria bacterium]